MHSDEGVEDVEKVTDVVENHPGCVEHVVQLPEDHPARHTDEVVEDGHVDDAQPLKEGVIMLIVDSVTESQCQTHMVVVSLARVHSQFSPGPAAAPQPALRVLLLALRHKAEPVEEGVGGGHVLAGGGAALTLRQTL